MHRRSTRPQSRPRGPRNSGDWRNRSPTPHRRPGPPLPSPRPGSPRPRRSGREDADKAKCGSRRRAREQIHRSDTTFVLNKEGLILRRGARISTRSGSRTWHAFVQYHLASARDSTHLPLTENHFSHPFTCFLLRIVNRVPPSTRHHFYGSFMGPLSFRLPSLVIK